ncbi:XkdF-like putative serine protease domain-containing protein [Shimazuella sp. AN120528]|uniref:XkdF-like putative serine protease domain-containing protein n=1 Tax=Shimazuella soli TaxID=1892854 RepID=UPI001F0EDD7C|nr:XkdF-like putative serine protease domain-containing protein [Shimazuella soli]MCH5586310.1 XkdF-like putative serine protease domain-containing protein [Shimazuella soli]
MSELTAPVVKRNDEKRLVYGPVLIPNEPDHDGDVVTKAKIEDVAHTFNERYGNIDLLHTLNNVGRVIESYIAPVDLEFGDVTIPEGSWIMGVRVTDEASWNAVKSGKLTGFSIMGIRSTATKSKEESDMVFKRTTLADLGEEWIVNAVSLVDEPAVPKAKFLVIKSKEPELPKDTGFFARLKQALSRNEESAESEGGEEMTREEIQVFIQSSIKAAMQEALEEWNPPLESDDPVTAQQQEHTLEEQSNPEETEVEQESKEHIILSKQEYETLLDRVQDMEKVVEKARGFGLFFRSNKLKGQDVDSSGQSKPIEQDRDIFGRRVQK